MYGLTRRELASPRQVPDKVPGAPPDGFKFEPDFTHLPHYLLITEAPDDALKARLTGACVRIAAQDEHEVKTQLALPVPSIAWFNCTARAVVPDSCMPTPAHHASCTR